MKWSSVALMLLVTGLIVVTMPSAIRGDSSSISVLPPSVGLTLFVGESGSYQLKVHNGGGTQVTVHLTIVVSKTPAGGSSVDIVLSFPSSIIVKTGNTYVPIGVKVSPTATPGLYVISNTVSL